MAEAMPEATENPGSFNDFACKRTELSRDELLELYDGALSRFRQSVRPDQGPPLHGVIDYLPHEVIRE